MKSNSLKEYPREELIELKGLSPELMGRLSISPNQGRFDVEVAIVLGESQKIYKHIDILHKLEDEREALNLGIHRLKQYLSSISGS